VKEHPKRSVTKSITWRVTASIATLIMVFLVTGSVKFAISLGIIEVFVKMTIYYFHERAWNNISWGVLDEE